MTNDQTLGITPYERKTIKQQYNKVRERQSLTGVVANCQLMLNRGGALFEFALSPQGVPVYVGRATEHTQPPINIDLSSFGASELGVSRIHASFERAGSRLLLRDLQSTNGTFVNGNRLTTTGYEVCHGDIIEFGRLSTTLYIRA